MNTQFSLGTKIKVGIIGFGRMGRFYWDAMKASVKKAARSIDNDDVKGGGGGGGNTGGGGGQ